jgi:hypothetical protein
MRDGQCRVIVEVADEITYLGIALESTGRWEKRKKKSW